MSTYTVHVYSTVSTAVDVEADDPESAADAVFDSADMPGSITHGAFGQGASVDHDGEWIAAAVTDDSGEEVWREQDKDAAELDRLRTIEQRLIACEGRVRDEDEAETLHWIRTGKGHG